MIKQNKFRILDIVEGKYIYSPSRQFLIGLDGRLFDGNGNPYDENHVIQQFTGLIDKNGKEIYEGDIIKYTPFNQLDYKDTVIKVPTLDKFHWFEELEMMLIEHANKCDIEVVIGNVHKNSVPQK